MKLKVAAGRVRGICIGCEHGQMLETETGDTVTFCNNMMVPFRVTRPVVRCTDFEDRTRENKYQMEKIAWTLTTDKKGNRVGFAPPQKKDD